MSRFSKPWSYLDRGTAVPNSLFWSQSTSGSGDSLTCVPALTRGWVWRAGWTWGSAPHSHRQRLGCVSVFWPWSCWQPRRSVCFIPEEGIFLEQLLPQVLSKASVLVGGEENWPAAHPASLKPSVGGLLVVAKSRILVLKSHCPTNFQ